MDGDSKKKQAAIEVGDRVVVVDPASAHDGCHGHVAGISSGSTTTVRLDTLQTTRVARVVAAAQNRESSPRTAAAPVFNGALDPRTETTGSVIGTAILHCFAAVRKLSRKKSGSADDEEKEESAQRKLECMQYAFDHWKENDMFSSLLQAEWPSPADQRILLPALRSTQAIASWHRGWVADVWVVGRNALGMYAVPTADVERSNGVVYRLVGIRNHVPTRSLPPAMPLDPPPKLIKTPMRVRLCIVPWYGRLLYDSSLLPEAGEMADASLAHRLHTIVMQAAAAANLQKRTQRQEALLVSSAEGGQVRPFHLVDHLAELSG